MAFVTVGGTAVHTAVDGSGPVCVLAAGLGMAWFDWDPVVELLAPHRTVVRFDRPGLGLSAPAPGPPDPAAEADRFGGVLDALGLTGPATVVGHSLAGFHAESFTRRHPARVNALVLLDTSLEERPVPRRPSPVPDLAVRAGVTALCRAGVPYALGPALRRLTIRAGRLGGAPDPAPPELVRAVYRTSRTARAIAAEHLTYPEAALYLAALRRTHALPAGLPVTVLAGARATAGPDPWLTRQRALAKALAARFRVAAPAGHFLTLDRPADVADTIRAATAR
ncbi:alpha/beta hydrolase [Streptomyces uncialis]|uniref:alpha/beta fold hydrolase n=1 Tax=Streptomyces uncialis TaxID=1048205 RepID=UPI002E30F0DF|nr:alpha/beta hydrolase [Streptomyces uncialis]